ncbi:DUF4199 domain-containing protein [Mucilaginibacter sp. E4BP6]|jgi:hypothetical protein|uniref:DUF4199 domain-containing protein n=1 Tax=Mucilaginibacter sp. E4BP6 TaxID=2723089 RepID=UPI0015CBF4EB|nr:DUF4199 domain-containing protein [Mucilaginibacter sp. E4BP6]NYE64700.1 tetrahydromethanopterin S-methyltransferase subunit F [Mucilaginibacter sp. E4BP6]
MKNAFITGVIIGVLSGLWLFIMHIAGYDLTKDQVSPFEYVSVIIPIAGLFFGLKSYRDNDLGGNMGFLEALIQCFKILILAGIIAIFAGILYISYVDAGNNARDFSGRMFAALLIGVLSALAVSLILTTKSNKVD